MSELKLCQKKEGDDDEDVSNLKMLVARMASVKPSTKGKLSEKDSTVIATSSVVRRPRKSS